MDDERIVPNQPRPPSLPLNPDWRGKGPAYKGPHALLSVVEQFYYQLPGSEPVAHFSSFGRRVESDEQPYSHAVEVGPEWAPVDVGWLKGKPVGMLRLSNMGVRRQVYPTKEEAEREASMDVLVGIATGEFAAPEGSGLRDSGEPHVVEFAVVPPKESARFQPMNVEDLRVRCLGGRVKCLVTVVPE